MKVEIRASYQAGLEERLWSLMKTECTGPRPRRPFPSPFTTLAVSCGARPLSPHSRRPGSLRTVGVRGSGLSFPHCTQDNSNSVCSQGGSGDRMVERQSAGNRWVSENIPEASLPLYPQPLCVPGRYESSLPPSAPVRPPDGPTSRSHHRGPIKGIRAQALYAAYVIYCTKLLSHPLRDEN